MDSQKFRELAHESSEKIKTATENIKKADSEQNLAVMIENLRIINPYLKNDDSYIKVLKECGYLKWYNN